MFFAIISGLPKIGIILNLLLRYTLPEHLKKPLCLEQNMFFLKNYFEYNF